MIKIFIVLFFIITIITISFISCIRENKQKKEYNKKLNSVVPGTLLVHIYHMSNNPFDTSPSNESSIKILDVKKDELGEIWIKYAEEDLWNNNGYLEDFPCYNKLENALYTYPNIVLPE